MLSLLIEGPIPTTFTTIAVDWPLLLHILLQHGLRRHTWGLSWCWEFPWLITLFTRHVL